MNIDPNNMHTTFNSLSNLKNHHTSGILEIINMCSYYVYIVNRIKDIKCTCISHETKQADHNCKRCLGTGNKIKIYKVFCASQDTQLPTTFRSDNFIVARNYFIPSKYKIEEDDLIVDKEDVYYAYKIQHMFSLEGTLPYNKVASNKKKFDANDFFKNFNEIINKKQKR